MARLEKVLILGGGIAGMSAAISFAKRGVAAEIVERDPDWRVYGAGISITGPTLRAFATLGLLDDIRREGFCSGGARLYAPTGRLIFDAPAPPGDIPSGAGIMRPALHRLLQTHVRAAGATVSLGVRAARIDPERGSVELSDGRRVEADLIVGADGLFSETRERLFPEAPRPVFTGQGGWRAIAPRPPEIDRAEIYLGADTKAGLNPVSDDEMYLFLLEHVPDNPRIEPSEHVARLKALLGAYGGHLDAVREGLSEASSIVYRPLECVLVPKPWHRGKAVLIGDAVHGTTPHLASGAGMSVEDAIVLADETACDVGLDAALTAFADRRFERCRIVVESSLRLGEIEMAHGDPAEHQQVSRAAGQALSAAI